MDSDGLRIAGIASSAEGKRALAASEDEQLGELIPQVLGLNSAGQQRQEGGHQQAAHGRLRIETMTRRVALSATFSTISVYSTIGCPAPAAVTVIQPVRREQSRRWRIHVPKHQTSAPRRPWAD